MKNIPYSCENSYLDYIKSNGLISKVDSVMKSNMTFDQFKIPNNEKINSQSFSLSKREKITISDNGIIYTRI